MYEFKQRRRTPEDHGICAGLVSTPHDMTSILQTNQSTKDRLIARKPAAWPIRLPLPPTHTVTWQAVQELDFCKKKKKDKTQSNNTLQHNGATVFASLICATTLLYSDLHFHYFTINWSSERQFLVFRCAMFPNLIIWSCIQVVCVEAHSG